MYPTTLLLATLTILGTVTAKPARASHSSASSSLLPSIRPTLLTTVTRNSNATVPTSLPPHPNVTPISDFSSKRAIATSYTDQGGSIVVVETGLTFSQRPRTTQPLNKRQTPVIETTLPPKDTSTPVNVVIVPTTTNTTPVVNARDFKTVIQGDSIVLIPTNIPDKRDIEERAVVSTFTTSNSIGIIETGLPPIILNPRTTTTPPLAAKGFKTVTQGDSVVLIPTDTPDKRDVEARGFKTITQGDSIILIPTDAPDKRDVEARGFKTVTQGDSLLLIPTDTPDKQKIEERAVASSFTTSNTLVVVETGLPLISRKLRTTTPLQGRGFTTSTRGESLVLIPTDTP